MKFINNIMYKLLKIFSKDELIILKYNIENIEPDLDKNIETKFKNIIEFNIYLSAVERFIKSKDKIHLVGILDKKQKERIVSLRDFYSIDDRYIINHNVIHKEVLNRIYNIKKGLADIDKADKLYYSLLSQPHIINIERYLNYIL